MTVTPATAEPIPLPDGGSVYRTVLRIPMRDGVELVADRYALTAEPAPAPVLLERTPYGRRERRGSDGLTRDGAPIQPVDQAAYFARRGLVLVRQDCRGRGDSDGTFVKYLGEAEDGYDTVEWLAAQPWCDGRVATTGVSYSAHAQTALAALAPPHLAAMFVDSGGFASAYEAGVRMGGAFELKQATWAFRHAQESPAARADPVVRAALDSQDLRAWFGALPWRRGLSPLAAVPEYEEYLLDQWAHGAFDGFWRQLGIYGRGWYDAFPDVPSLHMVSWYDPYVPTALENVRQLSARKTGPTRLVIGPWTHGARSVSYAGDVDFGPAATLDGNLAPDYLEFRADFLARHLAGEGGDDPAVRYFLMGGGSGRRTAEGRLDHGGSWRTASAWPPTETTPVTLYLRDGGTLGTDAPDGGTVEYDFDPARPVPTIGGQVTSGEPVMSGGAYDQVPGPGTYGGTAPYLPLASRPDVLVFQTPPLAADVALAGPVEVRLRVSSSAVDTDFTAKLVDVHPPNPDHPNGYAMNLTDGILRCRYRNSYERPEPMEPGAEYEIVVPVPDTANLFAAGHRIRLDVSSSNFPRFDVNPNTGGTEVDSRRRVVATNRVHLGPSGLTVHVLAGAEALPAS
ncbi:CocE/NonD family hydrolase [Actinocatenispora rupis]|uniref:Antibiotic hydrolase n=1 Tax=Actinocatenispora rupis TaxID=519421 RepID=A0A8J3NAI4_9ACTN|nr:CocE/NonD family hydrolase [Actinocatenispora rupis]GID09740.1 antibiotic hydrolase [Actinocatenispora rupis]